MGISENITDSPQPELETSKYYREKKEINLYEIIVDVIHEEEIKILISEAEEELKFSPETQEKLQSIGKTFGKGYVKWLILRLKDKSLKEEDVYKYEQYFKYFEQGRKLGHFTYNDILKYKSVAEFNKQAIESHEKIAGYQGENLEQDVKFLVSPQQIQMLENVGIKFLGLTPDGYQCFKIPKSLSGDQQAYETQRRILGRCQGREEGQGISICTMASQSHFASYLKNDDLYVFFNLKDPRSPYQFHYGSGSFMDRNDHSIIYH